jgi:hypothetical protein
MSTMIDSEFAQNHGGSLCMSHNRIKSLILRRSHIFYFTLLYHTFLELNRTPSCKRRWCSSASIVTRLQAGCPRFTSQQGQGRGFFFAATSRPALEPTHPSFQWVPRSFPKGKVARHLVSRLRMYRAMLPLP